MLNILVAQVLFTSESSMEMSLAKGRRDDLISNLLLSSYNEIIVFVENFDIDLSISSLIEL